MLDSVSLDQLRIFIAAAEGPSFSGAARKLRRSQSVVSQALANLELQLGISLFDRSGRTPQLTPQGLELLSSARQVIREMEGLKAQALEMSGGFEPELSVVVDVMFPRPLLTAALLAFATEFPRTRLRLYVEALGAVAEAVVSGRCTIGVIGSLSEAPPTLLREPLVCVPLVCVVARTHPLAGRKGPIPRAEAQRHVQLVLADRSSATQGIDFDVLSNNCWRLADLGAKEAFLLAGLGWGNMPQPFVAGALDNGALVPIEIEGLKQGVVLSMEAVYRADRHLGRASRWLIHRLGAADQAAGV